MASSLITEHKSTHCFLLCEVSCVGRRDAPCLDKFAVRVQCVGVGSSFLFFFPACKHYCVRIRVAQKRSTSGLAEWCIVKQKKSLALGSPINKPVTSLLDIGALFST